MKTGRLIPPRYVNVGVEAVFDAALPDGPARTYSRLCGLAWESRDEDKTTPPLTIEELAAICVLKRSAMWLHLRTLKDRGYIAWRTFRGRLIIRILQGAGNSVQNFGLTSAAAVDVDATDSDQNRMDQQQQQQAVVQNFGLVQSSGLVQKSGLVQNFGLVQNSGLEVNLEALREYGVEDSPYAVEVAGLAHVTPELIRAWGEHLQARHNVDNLPGLLLHILRTNTRPPREERRGGVRVRVRVDLPEDVEADLVAVGLVGSRAWREVADAFAGDPDRVRGWLAYVLDRRRRDTLENAPGFLLEMLRDGAPPPAVLVDSCDSRRYISGEYADLIQH